MSRSVLAALAAVAVLGCGKGGSGDQAAADSLGRDLQMAPADSGMAMNDRPAGSGTPTTKPATPRTTTRTLAAGTLISATADARLTSRSNKVGEVLSATVAEDVKDSRGRTVIPAGSKVTLTIADLKPAENKSQQDGTILLVPADVVVGGKSYSLVASIESVEHHLEGRGVTAGDVAKVGAGAAAGAVAGGVISGNKKGAVIGGVIGAAVGTGVAAQTADRDVVVDPGAKIVLKLTEDMTI
ncbi:MAG: hypothetical protein AB7Q69_16160 [Gemmatimonadales bacterium]